MLDLKAWIVTSASLITACATTASSTSIFYKTQAAADAALEAFEKTNPSCQLWTNWQKMCSRTGPNGAAACVVDPEVKVKPSAVFCSRDENSIKLLEVARLTPEQVSRDRFCTSFENKSPLSKRLGRSLCVDKDQNRPFSGFRMSSRFHPWCGEWKDKSSFKVATDKKSYSTSGYYCSRKLIPKWCKEADGFGEIPLGSPDHPKFRSGEIMILGTIDESLNSRVVGISCRKTQ